MGAGLEELLRGESTPSGRAGLGAFFRALVKVIEGRQLLDAVRERVAPATRALLDDPPRALGWVDGATIDDLETAFGQLVSREGLVQMGYEASRELSGDIVRPVLRMAFQLFGQSPESVFANLDRFYSMSTRGLHFGWEASSANSGTVVVRFDGPRTPMAPLLVLEGSLRFVFALTSSEGTVTLSDISADGTTVRYAARWR
jgi:hypothetical protein